MKRRELLMLVASSGTVFAPPLLGGEQTIDHIVDSDTTDSNEAGHKTEEDAETIEVTVELY
jgi:hypothetical protein